ncbi:MAG: thioesterase family protein [Acidobacteriota bacterium]
MASFSWPYHLDLPVRFRDVDAYGHVNNAVYFTYLEQARCECYMALLSRNDPCHQEEGLDFVVARAECDYVAPIHAGDVIRVEVRPSAVGTKSFAFAYEMTVDGTVRATGSTVLVAYEHRERQTKPLPAELAEELRAGLPDHA